MFIFYTVLDILCSIKFILLNSWVCALEVFLSNKHFEHTAVHSNACPDSLQMLKLLKVLSITICQLEKCLKVFLFSIIMYSNVQWVFRQVCFYAIIFQTKPYCFFGSQGEHMCNMRSISKMVGKTWIRLKICPRNQCRCQHQGYDKSSLDISSGSPKRVGGMD